MRYLFFVASTISLLIFTHVTVTFAGSHGGPTFMWTRTVHVQDGQGHKAPELAMKIKKYVEESVGINVELRFPVSGSPSRIVFATTFKSMDQQMMTNFKLESSQGWGPLMLEADNVFTSAYDEWWIIQ